MKEKRKNENKGEKYIIAALVTVLIASLVIIISYHYGPIEKKTIGVRFLVGEHIGFDLNNNEIVLGKIPPGGGASRGMIFKNDYNFSVIIKVYASKDIINYINIVSPFEIGPMNETKLNVSASIPADMKFGNYSGKLLFETWRK